MEKIEVGKIVNFHGVRGEMKVISESDFIKERFSKGCTVYIKNEPYEITSFRLHKNFVMIKFNGFDNLNMVEHFKNAKLFAPVLDIELEEDEYYYSELEGLEVYNETKEYIGKVIEVVEYPACEYLKIRKEDKTNVLIPFKKEFVLEVSETITIVSMEGLY